MKAKRQAETPRTDAPDALEPATAEPPSSEVDAAADPELAGGVLHGSDPTPITGDPPRAEEGAPPDGPVGSCNYCFGPVCFVRGNGRPGRSSLRYCVNCYRSVGAGEWTRTPEST